MGHPDRQLSKLLSLVLRHRPGLIGIELDAAGWADVEAVIDGIRAKGHGIDRAEVERLVATSDKQRFALSADRMRIRANQGHTIPVELGLEAAEPPATLYHGTHETALPSIRRQGLLKRKRHHVHLSYNAATAAIVGGRRGKAVVLHVDARAMHEKGHAFFRTENGVWLTDHVPPAFLGSVGEDASNGPT